MKKGKGKVVLAQPAVGAPVRPLLSRAPGPIRGAGAEAAYRASLRFRGLLQDFQELAKETEAKKRALHMEMLKKNKLKAEVNFLRKRFKFLSENPSRLIVWKLKRPAVPPPPSSRAAPRGDGRYVLAAGSSSKGVLVLKNPSLLKSPSPGIDLNEACQQNNEMEMEDNYVYHGQIEKVPIHNVKRYSEEGNAGPGSSDVKMPALWDAQNQAAMRAEKRKISWQDQLALRV